MPWPSRRAKAQSSARVPASTDEPTRLGWKRAPSSPVQATTTRPLRKLPAARRRDLPQWRAVHGRGRQGDVRVRVASQPARSLVSRPLRGRGGRPADRARPHRQGRLPGFRVLLPGWLPADHVGRRHQGPEDAAGPAERHRAVQVRRAEGQHHGHGRLRPVLGRAADPERAAVRLYRRRHHPRAGAPVGRDRRHRAARARAVRALSQE